MQIVYVRQDFLANISLFLASSPCNYCGVGQDARHSLCYANRDTQDVCFCFLPFGLFIVSNKFESLFRAKKLIFLGLLEWQ
jgi:hypothetical protein